jgi:hypothetical protein
VGVALTSQKKGTLLISSCAASQTVVQGYQCKGSIVKVSGDEICLSIGAKDGATVGQELSIYKIVTDSPKSVDGLAKEYTGKVKIIQVLGDHFAKGKIISGKADVHSIVELPF